MSRANAPTRQERLTARSHKTKRFLCGHCCTRCHSKDSCKSHIRAQHPNVRAVLIFEAGETVINDATDRQIAEWAMTPANHEGATR